MTDRPSPMVPPEVDLRTLPGFKLNVEKLLASELWALTRAAADAFRGAVALWCQAWKQIPAASLPDDEATLAAFAEMPVGKFRRERALVMRGFVLCSDGRWYHRTLADDALEAWPRHLTYQAKRETDRNRLKEWRANKRRNTDETTDETRHETPDETYFVRSKTRTGHKIPPSPSGRPPLPNDDRETAVAAWNTLAAELGLARVQRLTAQRRASLAKRLGECGGLLGWEAALERVRASDFLHGNNDRGWRADFDFMLQAKSFTKLMEGGYDRSGKASAEVDPADAERRRRAEIGRGVAAFRGRGSAGSGGQGRTDSGGDAGGGTGTPAGERGADRGGTRQAGPVGGGVQHPGQGLRGGDGVLHRGPEGLAQRPSPPGDGAGQGEPPLGPEATAGERNSRSSAGRNAGAADASKQTVPGLAAASEKGTAEILGRNDGGGAVASQLGGDGAQGEVADLSDDLTVMPGFLRRESAARD